MPRTKEVFTIYPRTLKNGKTVYYYRTYDENGMRTTGRTTNRATPAAARNYVMGLYRDGKLIPKKKKLSIALRRTSGSGENAGILLDAIQWARSQSRGNMLILSEAI